MAVKQVPLIMPDPKKDLADSLSNIIHRNIMTEFDYKHLSYHLVKTMRYRKMKYSDKIVIPAKRYNMKTYLKKGRISYKNAIKGSYASSLDVVGSYVLTKHIGNHKNYIFNSIYDGIQEWCVKKDIRHAEITFGK
jgi:hypothetical protein